MKKIIAFSVLLMILQIIGFSQTNSTKKIQVCLTENEMELYRLINNYRQQNKLPIIHFLRHYVLLPNSMQKMFV